MNFSKNYYQRNRFRFSENILNDSPTEECGIFGVFSSHNIDTFSLVQFGLFALQHRGQEACGFSVLKEGQISTFKQEGLVLDAFKSIDKTSDYQGNAAIGHTRYTTAGDKKKYNYQPLFAKNQYDTTVLSIAHNGNLINIQPLRNQLEKEGINFLATSDTEIMLRLIQKYLPEGIENAVKESVNHIEGAYSVLALTQEKLIAFRDPNGIRPLCIGVLDEKTYVLASESCALDAVGAQFFRDVLPGEMIIIDKEGFHSEIIFEKTQPKICAFEYIYFARPDSIIENIEAHKIRMKSGERLYQQSPVKADIVIGVPDSGVPAAIGFSKVSGIPFMPVLIKNRYIGRSFIVPTQEMRERVVNLKLNPIAGEIKGKKIVIIDDSIVRGTTSKRLVKILREAGAREIHFRSASPPIIAPCFLGIDTPDKSDLISASKNKEELKNYLKVNSLDFITIENLKELLGSENHCFGCFTGHYPVNQEIYEPDIFSGL
ncbi:MAG: amidophosphoribosyltransferase [Flavobacteriaceae bacterium]|jgi:amidophosphoribosyltransferase|nr:amidophosphoribosyltransferase [Flavobacteriaceae bacterium]